MAFHPAAGRRRRGAGGKLLNTSSERGHALLAQPGFSVLLVEQHLGFAQRVANRYHVLESGRVASHGDGGVTAEREVRAALAV
ncbi:hypothetical protein M3G91_19705 [Micromonospora chalcea]|uniref:hypothetical protein n=1 Tax=Micromonospora chalcea TaxID=1874 RepID=UPI0021A3F6DB|nr:hypothetical protein [Micromonospora chalcea]MCT2279842.1 hypothetical protein [Micromonospora chalcea]